MIPAAAYFNEDTKPPVIENGPSSSTKFFERQDDATLMTLLVLTKSNAMRDSSNWFPCSSTSCALKTKLEMRKGSSLREKWVQGKKTNRRGREKRKIEHLKTPARD
jgi:hypothetical protein